MTTTGKIALHELPVAGPLSGTEVVPLDDGTRTVTATVDAIRAGRTDVLSYILPGHHAAIRAGTHTADVSAAIAAALARGGDVYLPPGRYPIAAPADVTVAGTVFHGPGTLQLTAGFAGNAALRVRALAVTVKGLSIDGGAYTNITDAPVMGVFLDGNNYDTSGSTVENVTVRRVTLDGINVYGNKLAPRSGVTVRGCRVNDVGWSGISWAGNADGVCTDNRVERTGYHGLCIWSGRHVRFSGNYVCKATPPSRIFAGAGSLSGAEGGGLFFYHPDATDITVTDNDFVDNRNAGHDGIMAGEWDEAAGWNTEYHRYTVTGNRIKFAGGFGLDVVGSGTFSNNTIEDSAGAGIAVMFDRGGVIRDLTVSNNTVIGSGSHGIQVGGPIFASYGQYLAITDATFGGNTVSGAPYGITFVAFTTFTNVLVTGNNLAAVNIASVYNASGAVLSGVQFGVNTLKEAPYTPVGGSPGGVLDVTGGIASIDLYNGAGSTLSSIIGGHLGHRVTIRFGDGNTAVNFDWANTSAKGTDRLLGNGNVNRPARAGDVLDCVRTAVGWVCRFVDIPAAAPRLDVTGDVAAGGNITCNEVIVGNSMVVKSNAGAVGVYVRGRSDNIGGIEFYNQAGTTKQGYIQSWGNQMLFGYLNAEQFRFENGGMKFSVHLSPYADATYSLGISGRRWTDIWATNATIQTSDANAKTDVTETPLGLAFIQRLRPVRFRFKDIERAAVVETHTVERPVMQAVAKTREEVRLIDGQRRLVTVTEVVEEPAVTLEPLFDADGNPLRDADGVQRSVAVPVMETVTVEREVEPAVAVTHARYHDGLIAQEVKAALDGLGLDAAAYIYDPATDSHGIRYGELIAPLIRSVQELAIRVAALEGASQ